MINVNDIEIFNIFGRKITHPKNRSENADIPTSGRKISKGPRTIMLQIYVGSARNLSAKNSQNKKTARLILRKKYDFARHQHDRNR